MNAIERYECPTCNRRDTTAEDFSGCYNPEPVWICEKCAVAYYDQTEANECCTEETP